VNRHPAAAHPENDREAEHQDHQHLRLGHLRSGRLHVRQRHVDPQAVADKELGEIQPGKVDRDRVEQFDDEIAVSIEVAVGDAHYLELIADIEGGCEQLIRDDGQIAAEIGIAVDDVQQIMADAGNEAVKLEFERAAGIIESVHAGTIEIDKPGSAEGAALNIDIAAKRRRREGAIDLGVPTGLDVIAGNHVDTAAGLDIDKTARPGEFGTAPDIEPGGAAGPYCALIAEVRSGVDGDAGRNAIRDNHAVVDNPAGIEQDLPGGADGLVCADRQYVGVGRGEDAVLNIVAHHNLAGTTDGLPAQELHIGRAASRIQRQGPVIRDAVADAEILTIDLDDIGPRRQADIVENRTNTDRGADNPAAGHGQVATQKFDRIAG